MKKQFVLTGALTALMLLGSPTETNAQFGKLLKKAMSKKSKGSSSSSSSRKKRGGGKSEGTFKEFNDVKDDLNLSGEYHSLRNGGVVGFKFVKEDGGEIVNELHFFGKNTDKPDAKLRFKENFYNKKQIKMFFVWMSSSAESYVECFEVAPGVIARTEQTARSLNQYDQHAPLDAKRTVIEVLAKNKSDLETWDIETAQAKVDMLLATLNSAVYDKVKKKLMRYPVYKNYRGKIAFAKSTSVLRAQTKNKIQEKEADLITKREIGEDTAFKPYFELPLAASHPGTWYNITYEMAGVKTDREVLRKKSTKYSSNIGQLNDDRDQFYFLFPHILTSAGGRHADYAYLELLRLTQDKFKVGQTYELKVTVWAFKDGENVAPIAKGAIQLKYTENSKKRLFNPDNGLVVQLEDYLDE